MMWYVVGAAGAILTSFGFVPQVLKMWRNKSVRDVSYATFIQFTVGCVLWLVYGLSEKDFVIIAANVVTLGTLVIAITLYMKYIRDRSF